MLGLEMTTLERGLG